MPITTTNNITNLQEKVIGAARLTLKDDQSPIKNGFHIERANAGMDDTFNWPKLPGVTAFGLVEGVDMVTETIIDSSIAVSATEVGVAVEFTRKMLRTIKSGTFMRNMGKAMGSAISVKEEQDVATLVDGFGNFVGLDGASATIGQLSAAQTQLRANSEPLNSAMIGRVRACVTPAAWHDLAQMLFPTGSGDSHAPMSPTPDAVANRTFGRYGPTGNYFGTNIYLSTNLVTSGNNARGGVWHPDAGLFYEFMPVDMYTDDSDKSMRSVEMGMVVDYGFVEANDGFGREWRFDDTNPTS
jgi:hypothetical protein